jgi:hypothetical protein
MFNWPAVENRMEANEAEKGGESARPQANGKRGGPPDAARFGQT